MSQDVCQALKVMLALGSSDPGAECAGRSLNFLAFQKLPGVLLFPPANQWWS